MAGCLAAIYLAWRGERVSVFEYRYDRDLVGSAENAAALLPRICMFSKLFSDQENQKIGLCDYLRAQGESGGRYEGSATQIGVE